jgi:hypothetical protein
MEFKGNEGFESYLLKYKVRNPSKAGIMVQNFLTKITQGKKNFL